MAVIERVPQVPASYVSAVRKSYIVDKDGVLVPRFPGRTKGYDEHSELVYLDGEPLTRINHHGKDEYVLSEPMDWREEAGYI